MHPEPKQDGPENKKRKRSDEDGVHPSTHACSSTKNARYPDLMHANDAVHKAHMEVKKECDDLVQYCVRFIFFPDDSVC